jgi:hypothetical protein
MSTYVFTNASDFRVWAEDTMPNGYRVTCNYMSRVILTDDINATIVTFDGKNIICYLIDLDEDEHLKNYIRSQR